MSVPDPDEVAAALRELGGHVVEVGVSREGDPILAARFGDGPRAVRVIGGHHGDEGSAIVVTMAVARALSERGAPEGVEVWVVPVLNPDGTRAETRFNAADVDLNRNYSLAWDPDEPGAGEGPFSEPETRAMRALARARDFAGGVSLHSGATNIGWVWNWTTTERVVEEALLEDVAVDYAAACGAPGFWVTNGADWYLTPGEATDWDYAATGAYDFTLEVTEEKSPPNDQAPTYVSWHLEAILDLLARPVGREAQVVDAVTGEPIPARITGDDVGAAWTGPDGRYARWGPGGGLVAWAPGYEPAPLGEPLVPSSLVDRVPVLLSRGGGPVEVGVSGYLTMPGEPDVAFDGTIDPIALAPGAWTLTTDGGTTPRAVFVGEVDDRVTIDAVALEDDVLWLAGSGFGEGAEAWSIGGPARAMHPLIAIEESEEELVFAMPEDDDDVLVWTSGAWLSVLDVRGEPRVDEEAPPYGESPGVASERPLSVPGGCAGDVRVLAAALFLYRRPWRLRTSLSARFSAS
ncbi:MAG: DUF2817 domain-containing protein [Myxococcota bacterium]